MSNCLQNQQRDVKGKGLDNINAIEVSKESSLSGREDELWLLRKYCSDLENEKLSLTQENDVLRTERDKMRADFDEVKRKRRSLMDNSNAITKERHGNQRETDELKEQEGTLKLMFEKRSSIQEAQLTWTQESETLRSAHVELKVNFEERERERGVLKGSFNALREGHDSLQKAQGKLEYMEGGIKNVLDEISGIQTVLFKETQQRESLRLENEELKVKLEELGREHRKLRDNLNGAREERDSLQKDKDRLVDLECELRKTLDELLAIQKAQFAVTVERDSLRLENNELKANFEGLERECSTIIDNIIVLREKSDVLQKDKDKLKDLEGGLSSILEAQLVVNQEKESLRSEHKELKVHSEQLERECTSLNDSLNAMKAKLDALQKKKDKLLDLEGGMRRMLNEFSAIQKALLTVVRERATLKLERNDLIFKVRELQRKCDTQREDLNAIREERDALQKDKRLLIQLVNGMQETSDDPSDAEELPSAVTEEVETLRSELEQLEVNSEEAEGPEEEYICLSDSLNVIIAESGAALIEGIS
jgi:chromosome segregation ATPase